MNHSMMSIRVLCRASWWLGWFQRMELRGLRRVKVQASPRMALLRIFGGPTSTTRSEIGVRLQEQGRLRYLAIHKIFLHLPALQNILHHDLLLSCTLLTVYAERQCYPPPDLRFYVGMFSFLASRMVDDAGVH